MNEPSDKTTRRILIVDDNPAIHDDFRKILAPGAGTAAALEATEAGLFGLASPPNHRMRYEIDSAFQGRDAVGLVTRALAAGRPYSMAFVDIRMPPGWDGVKTTAEIWEADPDVQIVICTAYSDYSWDEMFGKIGNCDHLVILKKPFDAVEALQLTHALCEKWSLHRQSRRKMDELEVLVAGRTRELRESNDSLQRQQKELRILLSERLKTEEFLRQNEALLRIAGRTARLGGWAVNLPDHRITWSDEMCAIHEMPPGSRPDSEEAFGFIHPNSREACRIAFESCAGGGAPFDLEMDVTTATGRAIRVRSTGEARRDAAGLIDGVHGACQDITERKKLADQALRAQRMESIGTLAGGIAHDLNNVLAPIMMSIELLKLRESNPRRLDILSIIETSARHGANMVEQILYFARGVNGEQMRVHVGHLLDEIERIIGDTFPKNIGIQSHIPADLWAVLGDSTQLHQVLINLCVNARDAMPDGGTLTLTAENVHLDEQDAALNEGTKPGPHVFIHIEDTGCGIPPDIMEEIFDPFFTTKESGKGTGLGLSTSLAILKSHGGFVRAESRPGLGTCFQVGLPALSGTLPPETSDLADEFPLGNNELVLVVDDEVSVREITRRTLEAFNYRVVLASDGAQAVVIHTARHGEIAAVITDMMMPVMDGESTIRALRKTDPTVRVIATSGLACGGQVATLGMIHFLPKPFTAEALLTALHQILAEKAVNFAETEKLIGTSPGIT